MTDTSTLILERDSAVQWIRLNRPDARNAIDFTMLDALVDVLTSADVDPEVRALVVTGSGRDFCTGGEGPQPGAGASPSLVDYARPLGRFQDLFRVYWELETPVVSAVNGTTAGLGWLLALLADLVVAVEGARWTHVFTRRGMMPHGGDPYFLPRVLGLHRVTEAALLSDTITSETLAEWGAVNRLVGADQLDATAGELAQRLANGPTRSLGLTKRLYRRSLDADMSTMFAMEADATALISTTQDRVEGVRSLIEGRSPNFIGD